MWCMGCIRGDRAGPSRIRTRRHRHVREEVSRQSRIRILLEQFDPLKESWSRAHFSNNNGRARLAGCECHHAHRVIRVGQVTDNQRTA